MLPTTGVCCLLGDVLPTKGVYYLLGGVLPTRGVCCLLGGVAPSGQANRCKNITFPQLRWRPVILRKNRLWHIGYNPSEGCILLYTTPITCNGIASFVLNAFC